MRSFAVLVLGSLAACSTALVEPSLSEQIVVREPGATVSFVALGDFGDDSTFEAAVARSVETVNPDVVITLGDNNYPDGAAGTIDANIGKHYASFIAPYHGAFGPGGTQNRFFPSLGNHDWRTTDLEPYLDYFELPGNERYYDFVWGPVHFFALDSDSREPDGVDADSKQAQWLRSALAESTAAWQVVYLHHAPFSSGRHGSTVQLQWPYALWGADLVLAGHDHHYERIERDGTVYLVNGLSGSPKVYEQGRTVKGSQLFFNEEHGALFGEATETQLRVSFVTAGGETVDTVELTREASPAPVAPAVPAAPPPTSAPANFDSYED